MAGTGDNMKNDHQYAEVLEMMRSQGAKDNPTLAQIGVMQSSNSVKIDDLVLNAEGSVYSRLLSSRVYQTNKSTLCSWSICGYYTE